MKRRDGQLLTRLLLFAAFSVAASAQTPLPEGQVFSGTIKAALQQDLYSITPSAGDVVTIRYKRTSGNLAGYIGLRTAGGTLLKEAFATDGWGGITDSASIDYTFTQTGTYVVLVDSADWTGTGNYCVDWRRWNNPSKTSVLPQTQLVSGKRAQPLQLDMYTLTVEAGDSISLYAKRTSGNFGLYVQVRTMAGVLVTDATAKDMWGNVTDAIYIDYKFQDAGVYILGVDDCTGWTGTGDYALYWQRWNNPSNTAALPHVQLVSGKRTQLLQWDLYTFTVTAGDSITLRIKRTSGSFGAYMGLRSMAGALLTDAWAADMWGNVTDSAQIDYTFANGGTYVVVVGDWNGWSGVGEYSLYWQNWNNPPNRTGAAANPAFLRQTNAPDGTRSLHADGERRRHNNAPSEAHQRQLWR